MAAVIELNNVSTIYEGERIPALHNITLSINKGEFVAVIGPNGAGKTTLLETINGLLPATSGTVKVFGRDAKTHGPWIRKKIGYVIQNFEIDPLSPFLSKDVVMMGRAGRLGLLRFPKENDWRIAFKNLQLLGIEGFKNRAIGKLSGGEFQKVLIARALTQEPEILLLDEPLANLDVKSRRKVNDLLTTLNMEYGLTTVFVSHDIHAIPEICTRTIVLDQGRIVCQGELETVLSSSIVKQLWQRGKKHG
ncbi:MAG TPA: metal ABC transporter ATP-binding protein [Thermoplasmatales archaeon]|nr:metal ABC transporter ATP-binding protein [Thermoplasmatales archaeon]